MNHLSTICFTLFSFFLLESCSHRQRVEEPTSIVIVNRSARFIDIIRIKPCEALEKEFQEMGNGIKPGARRSILLSPGCFDAEALAKNGDVIGTQYNVKIPPMLRWSIY